MFCCCQTPSLLGWSDDSVHKCALCSCRRPGLTSQDPHCGSKSSNTSVPCYMSYFSDLHRRQIHMWFRYRHGGQILMKRIQINIRKQITRETTFSHFLNLSVCYLFKHIHNLINIFKDLLLKNLSWMRLKINFLK